eukprot:SAG22_NODE_190_length_15715_cov_21.164980_2_plen_417_part_00
MAKKSNKAKKKKKKSSGDAQAGGDGPVDARREKDVFEGGESFLAFDNPVTDHASAAGGTGPADDRFGLTVDSGPSDSAFDSVFEVETSPPSSPTGRHMQRTASVDDDGSLLSPVGVDSGIDLDGIDLDDDEIMHNRQSHYYMVFMVITVLLLPFYFLIFVFTLWLLYLVPNTLSVVGSVVSAVLPIVLSVGLRAARRMKMSQLRFYSFLMMLAVNLQISLSLVLTFDRAVSNAYLGSLVYAAQQLCTDLAGGVSMPLGAKLIPTTELCACTSIYMSDGSWQSLEETLSAARPPPNSTQIPSNAMAEDVMVCMTGVLESLGVGHTELSIFSACTLIAELALAYLGYHMIEDVEVKSEKKDAKKKGGQQIASIRGEIIGADGPLSGHTKPPSKRKNNFSSRYAELSLNAPGLHNKEHR